MHETEPDGAPVGCSGCGERLGASAEDPELNGDRAELSAEVIVQPAVQKGVDAGRSKSERLQTEVDQLDPMSCHHGAVEFDHEGEDVPG